MGKIRSERARFGQRLKRLRELKGGMTQNELAAKSGVSVDLICNYEQGKSFAKDEALCALASALKVSPAVFEACKLDFVADLDARGGVCSAAHFLLQVSDAYGVRPYVDGDVAGICADEGYIEYAFCSWADAVGADSSDGCSAQDSCCDEKDSSSRSLRKSSSAHVKAEVSREEWFILNFDEPFNADECVMIEPPSERIRELRAQCGLSQQALAEETGISVFSLRSYEQGRRSLNDAHRRILAKAFDIAPEALLGFGIDNPAMTVHFLFELAYLLRLEPRKLPNGNVAVSGVSGENQERLALFESFVRAWHEALRVYSNSHDKDAYRRWALRYGLEEN